MGVGILVLVGVITVTPVASLAGQGTTPGSDEESNGELLGTPLLEPAVGLIEVQEIAIEGQADAAVESVELEGEDGRLVYEVTLGNGTEIEIDATTGEVLETEQGDDGEDEDDEEAEDDEGENEEEDEDD